MAQRQTPSIVDHFSIIQDPRIERTKEHKLLDIIVIALCGVISGADGWYEVEEFGNEKLEWLKTFLELNNGIPSHDTFGRVFAAINPEEFKKGFASWIEAISGRVQGVVAIDGKTVRRSHDNKSGKAAIHMVSAWAANNRIVLGQTKVDDKSNEITAIPELLNQLLLKGCIVTIDAMGCQKEIAEKIRDRKADYVLAVKGNQGTLHDDIKLYFDDAEKNNFKGIKSSYHKTLDKDHGRIEKREYWTVSDIGWLYKKEQWKDVASIGMVKSERTIGRDTTVETRYYITSLESNAGEFAESVRNHWAIENSLHWVLDMAFREDECRVRKEHAPENFAMLRHIALNLLKQETTSKGGIKTKRMKSAWSTNYLEKVLGVSQ
jgi:predicted transposase YbfD/YdcC